METKFQTSFIPKTTIAPVSDFRPRRQTSLLIVISFFLFLISVLLGGLSFGYHKFLQSQKRGIQADLEKNIRAFEPDTIRRYARLDNRMDTSKAILEKHIAVSYLLEFLGKETLKSVRFLDMKYDLANDGKTASITMGGVASGYNAVAYQSSVFGKNSNLKDTLFTDLDLDKIGNVIFNLSFKLDSSFIYYKKKAAEFNKEALPPEVSGDGLEDPMGLN